MTMAFSSKREWHPERVFEMMREYRRRYSYRDLQELLYAARCNDPVLARVLEINRRGEMSPEETMTFAALVLAADNARLREALHDAMLSTRGISMP